MAIKGPNRTGSPAFFLPKRRGIARKSRADKAENQIKRRAVSGESQKAAPVESTRSPVPMDFWETRYSTTYMVKTRAADKRLSPAPCRRKAVMNPVIVVSVIVSLWGVINDPTTKGLSDSAQAMTYTEPKQEETK